MLIVTFKEKHFASRALIPKDANTASMSWMVNSTRILTPLCALPICLRDDEGTPSSGRF